MEVKDFMRLQMTDVVKRGREYYRVVYRENETYTLSALYVQQNGKRDSMMILTASNCKNFELVK